jgi:hypothetical protein
VVSGQLHIPDAFFTSGERAPSIRLGGPQSQSGRYGEVKIIYPTGTQTPTPVVQPVGSLYTDYTTTAL